MNSWSALPKVVGLMTIVGLVVTCDGSPGGFEPSCSGSVITSAPTLTLKPGTSALLSGHYYGCGSGTPWVSFEITAGQALIDVTTVNDTLASVIGRAPGIARISVTSKWDSQKGTTIGVTVTTD